MATINVGKTCSVLPVLSQNQRKMSILTDCDVNEILERKFANSNIQLVDWKLVLIDQNKGFLGLYYHLRVTAIVDEKLKNLQFFVKTLSLEDNRQDIFQMKCNLLNKEINIYTDLMPRMGTGKGPKWMVECYFSKRDTVIVLEDAMLDGYVTLDKFMPFDEEHCVWTARTISRLHSRSLIFDEVLRKKSGQTVYDLYRHMLEEALFQEKNEISRKCISSHILGFNAMVDFFEEIDADAKIDVKRRIKEWYQKLPRLLAPSNKHRNVICHRDIWVNNLMFQYDPAGKLSGCYLIDFQFFCYSPPVIDLMVCLYAIIDRATRDRLFDALVKIYHESVAQYLAEEGFDIEDCLPWTAFQKSLADARNIGLIYASLSLQIMLMDKEILVNYFHTDFKVEHFTFEEERGNILRLLCEKEPMFRTRILEIVLEIKDHLPEHPPNF